ncbi:MAG: glycoside hydrolase family 20 protein [Bacteroidales bacterium]|jgi:hexosaminidase|nr:glycoside hydrolase family 20 protein [Bacteroidales bacterium]
MRLSSFFTLVAATLLLTSCNESRIKKTSLVPLPVEMKLQTGHFRLKPDARITWSGGAGAAITSGQLAAMLQPATGYHLATAGGTDGDIRLLIDATTTWKKEEYLLEVRRKSITLTAGTAEGLFRGTQTLMQLLPPEICSDDPAGNVKWRIPCVRITDYPRFGWRGMHLDVSRHFFDKEFVKKYIDILAMHKINVFHWHLVDDQGWRIEIKKYPKLTEVGAWRVDREEMPWDSREPQQPGEKATYGGFYTQDDIREIVDYAAERYITVVPEIEMPAHVGSALAACPEYSCTDGPFTVPPGGVWPITDIYCAGKDETFAFLEDVLTEVMDLFPSEYIHIGGDEADKKEWKRCPDCQTRIRTEGLKDEHELQSYFIRRIERFLVDNGRKLIGWDEILQGGLAPEATVMSWQGFEGGIKAATSGHRAVMAPVSHCYFNVYQGDPATEPESFRGQLTLRKVYSFEPVPPELSPEESEYIIGAQGCLWTEYITDGATAEYMILPRLTALSEVVWTPAGQRSWEGFNHRLTKMMKRFDEAGFNYSRGSCRVDMSASFDEGSNSILLEMISEQPSPEIRYTTDGTDPQADSPRYRKALKMDESATVRAAIFDNGKMIGSISQKKISINKATGRQVNYNIPISDRYRGQGNNTLVNGIRGTGDFNDGHWQGFEGTDMDVVIDLGKEADITTVSSSFMAAVGSWIFLPRSVEYSFSVDGRQFTPLETVNTDIDPAEQGNMTETYSSSFPAVTVRYVRIVARGLITCPPWHAGAGNKAWLFCDEIAVE